jgi:hypothetical protein
MLPLGAGRFHDHLQLLTMKLAAGLVLILLFLPVKVAAQVGFAGWEVQISEVAPQLQPGETYPVEFVVSPDCPSVGEVYPVTKLKLHYNSSNPDALYASSGWVLDYGRFVCGVNQPPPRTVHANLTVAPDARPGAYNFTWSLHREIEEPFRNSPLPPEVIAVSVIEVPPENQVDFNRPSPDGGLAVLFVLVAMLVWKRGRRRLQS